MILKDGELLFPGQGGKRDTLRIVFCIIMRNRGQKQSRIKNPSGEGLSEKILWINLKP